MSAAGLSDVETPEYHITLRCCLGLQPPAERPRNLSASDGLHQPDRLLKQSLEGLLSARSGS